MRANTISYIKAQVVDIIYRSLEITKKIDKHQSLRLITSSSPPTWTLTKDMDVRC